jgi:hypothetical protein
LISQFADGEDRNAYQVFVKGDAFMRLFLQVFALVSAFGPLPASAGRYGHFSFDENCYIRADGDQLSITQGNITLSSIYLEMNEVTEKFKELNSQGLCAQNQVSCRIRIVNGNYFVDQNGHRVSLYVLAYDQVKQWLDELQEAGACALP